MADKKNTVTYVPLDPVLVRTPLLPVESYRPGARRTGRSDWVDAAIAVGSLSLAHAGPSERAAAPRLRYDIRRRRVPLPTVCFPASAWPDGTKPQLFRSTMHRRVPVRVRTWGGFFAWPWNWSPGGTFGVR
jgi:hypothetical protein